MMNLFGNLGGFDLLMKHLQEAEMVEEAKEEGQSDITTFGILSSCLTQPHLVYHKQFIQENAANIADNVTKRLLAASDKSLREVRKEQIDGILKSVENL